MLLPSDVEKVKLSSWRYTSASVGLAPQGLVLLPTELLPHKVVSSLPITVSTLPLRCRRRDCLRQDTHTSQQKLKAFFYEKSLGARTAPAHTPNTRTSSIHPKPPTPTHLPILLLSWEGGITFASIRTKTGPPPPYRELAAPPSRCARPPPLLCPKHYNLAFVLIGKMEGRNPSSLAKPFASTRRNFTRQTPAKKSTSVLRALWLNSGSQPVTNRCHRGVVVESKRVNKESKRVKKSQKMPKRVKSSQL